MYLKVTQWLSNLGGSAMVSCKEKKNSFEKSFIKKWIHSKLNAFFVRYIIVKYVAFEMPINVACVPKYRTQFIMRIDPREVASGNETTILLQTDNKYHEYWHLRFFSIQVWFIEDWSEHSREIPCIRTITCTFLEPWGVPVI